MRLSIRRVWSLLFAGTLVLGACAGSEKSQKDDSKQEESASDDQRDESASSQSADESKSSEERAEDKSKSDSKQSGDSASLPLEATGPVAKIDGNKISAKTFNDQIRERFGGRRRSLSRAMAKRMRDKLLESMIDKRLIEREIREAGLSVSEKEVDREFSAFKDRFPNDKVFEAFLNRRNMTRKSLRKKIRKDVKLKKLLKKRQGVEVTKKDARKYYDSHQKEFQRPEQVKARHILIKVSKKGDAKAEEEAKKRAEELAEKARKSGTDFAELARKHSDGPSAKKGGDLGYFTRDRMVEEFSKKAFSMKNGEISDPVKTDFGYHVIKREGHKPKRTEKFGDVKEEIIRKLERKRYRRAIDKFTKKLRRNATVEKMPGNIRINAEERDRRQSGPGGIGGGGMRLKKK